RLQFVRQEFERTYGDGKVRKLREFRLGITVGARAHPPACAQCGEQHPTATYLRAEGSRPAVDGVQHRRPGHDDAYEVHRFLQVPSRAVGTVWIGGSTP